MTISDGRKQCWVLLLMFTWNNLSRDKGWTKHFKLLHLVHIKITQTKNILPFDEKDLSSFVIQFTCTFNEILIWVGIINSKTLSIVWLLQHIICGIYQYASDLKLIRPSIWALKFSSKKTFIQINSIVTIFYWSPFIQSAKIYK